jgi:alkaline phosphatase D
MRNDHWTLDAAMNTPPRRRFVRLMGATGLLAASAVTLHGCGSDGDGQEVSFAHGVASGDPLVDRVILWTRVTPKLIEPVDLVWQVAADVGFTNVLRAGTVRATPDADFTAKVDATGLAPGRTYFYRFGFGTQYSATGRMRTLPAQGVSRVRIAVFSCANYPAGFFNVYADAARQDDIDCAIHLGDYLYEYAKDGYASGQSAALDRVSVPASELVTLTDYRRRYAQYRSDPDLQAVHAAMPMIAVWDDHEVANNAWRDGAENHDPASEGPYAARRAAALQAYHEWLPTRLPDPARNDRIYRSFDFGDLVSLHMLDTRLVARDRQIDLLSYVNGTAFDATRFETDLADPARQLLGAEQTAWLRQSIGASRARWQMLGQQVLMARMPVPAPLLLQTVTVSDYARLLLKARLTPQSLTAQEQAVLAAPSVPYNMDAWDGYPNAREAVLAMATEFDRDLVVLSGDTHNAWASDLKDATGRQVGVEFAGPSVTSPGFEDIFPDEDPVLFARALEQLIGPLVYADTSQRGYLVVTATRDEVRADWRYVSTITSRQYTTGVGKSLRVLPGAGNRRIVPVV